MKLLIVGHRNELWQGVCAYLRSEKYFCDSVYDLKADREKISAGKYSCIILDISLPHGNRMDILKSLKMDSLEEKLQFLKAGADDFVTKPFQLEELEGRIAEVILRKTFRGKNKTRFGKLLFDVREKTLKSSAGNVALTRTEYLLLSCFICNQAKVMDMEAIAACLYDNTCAREGSYDTVYTHIKNLRKKLKSAGSGDCIHNIYGLGYEFLSDNL